MRERHGKIDFAKLDTALEGVIPCNSMGAYYILPQLIWSYRAHTVIEIGVRHGYTTTILAEVLSQLFVSPTLISVDVNYNAAEIARRIHARYKTLRSIVHRADSGTTDFTQLLADVDKLDARLIFIDGDHRTSQVIKDIRATIPALAETGVFLFHDYDDYMKQEGQDVPEAVHLCFGQYPKNWIVNLLPCPVGRPFATVVMNHGDGCLLANQPAKEGRKWIR